MAGAAALQVASLPDGRGRPSAVWRHSLRGRVLAHRPRLHCVHVHRLREIFPPRLPHDLRSARPQRRPSTAADELVLAGDAGPFHIRVAFHELGVGRHADVPILPLGSGQVCVHCGGLRRHFLLGPPQQNCVLPSSTRRAGEHVAFSVLVSSSDYHCAATSGLSRRCLGLDRLFLDLGLAYVHAGPSLQPHAERGGGRRAASGSDGEAEGLGSADFVIGERFRERK
mmetsp:Transcript_174904/g.560820  ORF Transcript_174904/g.560820 Transcript_174904/m.560820 type:complete len:226 (+) Transcript_174904:1103-1780(+)